MLRGEGGGRTCAHKQDPKETTRKQSFGGGFAQISTRHHQRRASVRNGIINAARRFATWFITHARLQYLATIIEDAGTMLPSRSQILSWSACLLRYLADKTAVKLLTSHVITCQVGCLQKACTPNPSRAWEVWMAVSEYTRSEACKGEKEKRVLRRKISILVLG